MTGDRHDDDVDEWLDEQDERQALESAYWADLGALFTGPLLPALADVRCRACQVAALPSASRRLGRVLDTPLGLLLTIDTPQLVLDPRVLPTTAGPAATLSRGSVRPALGRGVALSAPDGWILGGPHAIAARLPWWFDVDLEPAGPPSRFGRPAVVCRVHGRRPVDSAAVAVRARAGERNVDV